MPDTTYDCAIIGGGLAGLCLAIQLAKDKKKVILFEKEAYPFHKVCGEYIALESWDFLDKLGVPLSQMQLPRITKLKVSAPNGNCIEQTLNPGGFGISRFTLDKLLFEIAVKAGVEVHTKTKVLDVLYDEDAFKVKTSDSTYTVKFVAGAFGKRSNLDVKLNRKFIQNKTDYVAVKYHVKANLPDDSIELHNFKDGYCGISKVDEGRYCICYLTTAQNLKKEGGNIAQLQANVLFQNPYLRRYFSEFPSLYEKPLVISQINFSKKSCFEQHILMLGDAAGMITPLCGNGMSMAMHASKIAHQQLITFLDGKCSRAELETNYAKEWKQQFGARIKAGRIIQRFFGNKIITNLFVASLKPYPKLCAYLISLTHGKPF